MCSDRIVVFQKPCSSLAQASVRCVAVIRPESGARRTSQHRSNERLTGRTADASFMMNVSDFHTAVSHNLPLTVFVFNDNAHLRRFHNVAQYLHDHPKPSTRARRQIARDNGGGDIGRRHRRLDIFGHQTSRPKTQAGHSAQRSAFMSLNTCMITTSAASTIGEAMALRDDAH
jgi:Thiamine pyrophosphate enzyme, C-terminal TPP binding domain